MRNKVCRLVFLLLAIGLTGQAWGVEILEPKAGAVFAPGDRVTVKARPSSGETVRLIHFYTNLREGGGTDPFDFIPPYEWEFTIPLQYTGIVEIVADGAPPKGSNAPLFPATEIAITVVLPPTTVLQGIRVRNDQKKMFMTVGETSNLYLYGQFSDGVERFFLLYGHHLHQQ
jgi:hypothetical protein